MPFQCRGREAAQLPSILQYPSPTPAKSSNVSLLLTPLGACWALCTNCTLLSLLIYLVTETRAGECPEDNQSGAGPSNSGLCPGKLDPRTIFLVSFTHPCFPFHHFGLYLRWARENNSIVPLDSFKLQSEKESIAFRRRHSSRRYGWFTLFIYKGVGNKEKSG